MERLDTMETRQSRSSRPPRPPPPVFTPSTLVEVASSSSCCPTVTITTCQSESAVPLSSSSLSSCSSRSWRSHSLTPSAETVDSSLATLPKFGSERRRRVSNVSSDYSGWRLASRSQSLTLRSPSSTFETLNARSALKTPPTPCSSSPQSFFWGSVSHSSTTGDSELDEMIVRLPENSGMRELHEWLKSLRLHKYTRLLLELSYEELLALTDLQLAAYQVTQGARGKILKEIGLIHERPGRLADIRAALDDVGVSNDFDRLQLLLPDLERLILMPLKHSTPLRVDDPSRTIVDELFEILRKICTIVLLNHTSHHGVVTIYVCLLERCVAKEAFSVDHKQSFRAWSHRLRTVWNPPTIRKAHDYRRRWDHTRRLSLQQHRNLANPSCYRGVSVIPQSISEQPVSTATTNLDLTSASQRASVSEIPVVAHLLPQPRVRLDESGANESDLLATCRRTSRTGSFLSTPSISRRESTLSTDSGLHLSLPVSRRSSSNCGCLNCSYWESECNFFTLRRDSGLSTPGDTTHRRLFAANEEEDNEQEEENVNNDNDTDLVHDLHELTLSVTEQALE